MFGGHPTYDNIRNPPMRQLKKSVAKLNSIPPSLSPPRFLDAAGLPFVSRATAVTGLLADCCHYSPFAPLLFKLSETDFLNSSEESKIFFWYRQWGHQPAASRRYLS